MMLDFLDTIVTAALMTLIVDALVIHLEIRRGAKLVLAGIGGDRVSRRRIRVRLAHDRETVSSHWNSCRLSPQRLPQSGRLPAGLSWDCRHG
jgi:hypothetical protein